MADFAASNAGHSADFANGEWREIVMQHQALFGLAFKPLDALHVVRSAKRGSNQGLRLTTSEDGGAVSTGQNAGFYPDRTDFVECAAVRAAALVRDLITENAFPQQLVIMG